MPNRQDQGESQVGGRHPRILPPDEDELEQATDAQSQSAPQNPAPDVADEDKDEDEDEGDDEVSDDEEDDVEANEEDGSGGHV